MNGARGVRVQGTDGTDFQHRQQVDTRYEQLASAKSFIAITGQISAGIGAYSIITSLFDANALGMNFGIIPPVVLVILTLSIWALSNSVSSSVVDPSTVALHKLLCNLMWFLSAVVLGSVGIELLVNQNFAAWLMYLTIPVYLFSMLIARRSAQADDEIIAALETKKGGNKNKSK